MYNAIIFYDPYHHYYAFDIAKKQAKRERIPNELTLQSRYRKKNKNYIISRLAQVYCITIRLWYFEE